MHGAPAPTASRSTCPPARKAFIRLGGDVGGGPGESENAGGAPRSVPLFDLNRDDVADGFLVFDDEDRLDATR